MRVWRVQKPGPLTHRPLRLTDEPRPEPVDGELLVRVLACGVCRTDLHLVEGDLPVHREHVTPGHEVVGEVVEPGEAFRRGDKVGIRWLRGTCGGGEGGYADYATAPEPYALPLPNNYSDVELAPLLCAGIIGFAALKRAELPAGGRLGIYGFGASAHLAAQVALAQGATVHV